MEQDPIPHLIYKKKKPYLKQIKDLNLQRDTIKLLGENKGETMQDVEISKDS